MPQNHLQRIQPLSVFLDVLINGIFIALGAVIYYHFNIQKLAPVDLHPRLVSAFGSKSTAVLVVSGFPMVIGIQGIVATIVRLVKRVKGQR